MRATKSVSKFVEATRRDPTSFAHTRVPHQQHVIVREDEILGVVEPVREPMAA